MKPRHAVGWMIAGVTMLAGQQLIDTVDGRAGDAAYAQPVATARQVMKPNAVGPQDVSAVQVASAESFGF